MTTTEGARLRFPSLDTFDLDGGAHRLPDGLPSGPRVVLVAFDMSHRRLLAEAVARLGTVSASPFGIWACLVQADGYRDVHDATTRMRGDRIEDPEWRRRILAAYTDLRGFASALTLTSLQRPCAFLLDERGLIYWRSALPLDDGAIRTFERALNDIAGVTGPERVRTT